MSWWFPTFTPDGRIVSGDGTVWLDGQTVGPGYSPVSVTAARAIVADAAGNAAGLLTLADGRLEVLPWAFSGRVGNVSGVSGGAGHWCGFAPNLGLVADGAVVDNRAAPGSIDRRTGRLAYLTPYHSDLRDVVVGGQVIRRNVFASEIRAADGAVLWSEYEHGIRKTWGFRGDVAERVSVLGPEEFEFTGVPLLLAGLLWIVVGTHKGLIVYPWGDPMGYVLEDEFFYHDAAGIDGVLRIVATSGHGALQYATMNPFLERRDLRDYHPTSGGGGNGGGGNGGGGEEAMITPVVTVHKWTLDELEDGREFVFEDTANPSLGYRIRVHVAGGSMYAEIHNAKGKASTGKARPVKPCNGDDGNGGEEPVETTTRISTYHGSFWSRNRDNVVEQSEHADFFTLQLQPNGAAAIAANNGLYVCAENGGQDDYLIANRLQPGTWETFQIGPSGDPERPHGFTLRAVNDRYVAAEGDGRITCNREGAGTWETFEADRPIVTSLPRLVIRDRVYFGQENGARFHVAECSDFSLYKRYLDGEDIAPILSQRSSIGFNCLRVWLLNTSVIPGGLLPSSYPEFYEKIAPFLAECERFGLYVELTAFTQTQSLMPDPNDQLEHWRKVGEAVRNSRNVIVELCNEIDQHDNAPSASFDRLDGVLCSSGSNGADHAPPVPPLWDYVLYHTNDLPEWQRKVSHNAMADGADVYGVPCISNENTRYPDRDSSMHHAYDAGAGSALLCAGACFHSVHGKTSEPFEGTELEAAKQWIAGVRSTPLEYQPGVYSRHDEYNGPDCIRAYARTLPDGRSWLVKIRP